MKERGTIYKLGKVEAITTKAGRQMYKQQVVVEFIDGNFLRRVAMDAVTDGAIDAIARMDVGAPVEVTYSVKSREWNDRWYTDVTLLGEMLADTHGCGLAEITLPEIAFAVRRAVLTENLYGVNVATLYRAIVRYAQSDGAKLEAVRPITPDQLATIKAAYAGQMMKQVK